MPEDLPITSFRTWQAVADLRHHARKLRTAAAPTLAALAKLCPAEVDTHITRLCGSGCLINDEVMPLLPALEVAAAEPANLDAFAFSLCVMLADLLQQGRKVGGLDWYWTTYADDIRRPSPSCRAAIANAYLRCEMVGCFDLEAPPTDEDCFTENAAVLLPELCAIAKSLTPEERHSISLADYGDRASEHLAALNKVIDEQDCLFVEGQHWYPQEVIELTSHDPSHPGHAGCLAILLSNAIAGRDRFNWIDFRWSRQGETLNTFKDQKTRTLMRGFRHEYESGSIHLTYDRARSFNADLYPNRLIPIIE